MLHPPGDSKLLPCWGNDCGRGPPWRAVATKAGRGRRTDLASPRPGEQRKQIGEKRDHPKEATAAMQLDEVKPNLEDRNVMNTESLWFDTTPAAAFPRLDQDLQVDVLIVGGGITGLTAAYLICKTGRSVALVERGTIGNRETGHTTAHLTYATDVRLSDLVKRFGPDHARAAWEAGASAMAQIQALVAEHQIECELRRAPAFLVVAGAADVRAESERLREEANVASEMG